MESSKVCPQCNAECEESAVLCISCGLFFNTGNKAVDPLEKERLKKENHKKLINRQYKKYALIAIAVLIFISCAIYKFYNPSSVKTEIVNNSRGTIADRTLRRHFLGIINNAGYWGEAMSRIDEQQVTAKLEITAIGGNAVGIKSYTDGSVELKVQMLYEGTPFFNLEMSERVPKSVNKINPLSDIKTEVLTKTFTNMLDTHLEPVIEDLSKQLNLIRIFKYGKENEIRSNFISNIVKYRNIAAAQYAPDWGEKYIWSAILSDKERLTTSERNAFLKEMVKSGLSLRGDRDLIKYMAKNRISEFVNVRLNGKNPDQFLFEAALDLYGYLEKEMKEVPITKIIDHFYYRPELVNAFSSYSSLKHDARYKYDQSIAKINKMRSYLVKNYFVKNPKKISELYKRAVQQKSEFSSYLLLTDLFNVLNDQKDSAIKEKLSKKLLEFLQNSKFKNLVERILLEQVKINGLPYDEISQFALNILKNKKYPEIEYDKIVYIDGPDVKGIGLKQGFKVITCPSNLNSPLGYQIKLYHAYKKEYLIPEKTKIEGYFGQYPLVLVNLPEYLKERNISFNFYRSSGVNYLLKRTMNGEAQTTLVPDCLWKPDYLFYQAVLDRNKSANTVPHQSIVFSDRGELLGFLNTNKSNILINRSSSVSEIPELERRISNAHQMISKETEILQRNNMYEVGSFYRLLYYYTEEKKWMSKLHQYYKSIGKNTLAAAYEKYSD